ncbi:hypothetical protein ACFQ36_02800 [Arthrobacter sp. GCM10027362]|uniref:hypothetical protein n=1 Tax=Arthrobacter sp. GCM10027362 TaxID=3273379 RepID=UPI003643667C
MDATRAPEASSALEVELKKFLGVSTLPTRPARPASERRRQPAPGPLTDTTVVRDTILDLLPEGRRSHPAWRAFANLAGHTAAERIRALHARQARDTRQDQLAADAVAGLGLPDPDGES